MHEHSRRVTTFLRFAILGIKLSADLKSEILLPRDNNTLSPLHTHIMNEEKKSTTASKSIDENLLNSTTEQDQQQLNETPPPQYWNSEPSSQPPSYNNKTCGKPPWRPTSAASMAAILGPAPPPEQHRTWAERFHDLKWRRQYDDREIGMGRRSDMARSGTQAKWNSGSGPLFVGGKK